MYEGFAEDYLVHARESAYNAYYDRPAVLEALGQVRGLRVLDAGCGPGLLAGEPDGCLVVSTHHPTGDWLRQSGSYFTVEKISETGGRGWQVAYWRQPLETTCGEFAAAGFLIDGLYEPEPSEELRRRYPGAAEKLALEPGFIVFRLIKR
jgi:hypothetical protein